MMCMLKQVLSIQDISQLLKSLTEHISKTELYDQFRITQAKVLEDICSRVNQTAEKGKDALTKPVLSSIAFNARRTAAERILPNLRKIRQNIIRKKEKLKCRTSFLLYTVNGRCYVDRVFYLCPAPKNPDVLPSIPWFVAAVTLHLSWKHL